MKRKGAVKRTATSTTSKKRSSGSGSGSVSASMRSGSSSLADLEVQLGKASLRQRSSVGLVSRVMDFEEEDRGDSMDAEAPLANVDCILSQDFFCTPDYITPSDQNVVSGLDCGKGEDVVRCPKSPEKTITASSKRYGQDHTIINSKSPILFGNEHLESLTDAEEDDEARFEKRKTNGLEKPHSYVSQSAVSLRCRVMPPPCIENPFLRTTSYVDVGPLGNQRVRFPGFFPAVVGGDGLSRYHTDFHEIKQIGAGNFSHVFQVLKRIDGCLYAVKRSTRRLHLDRERRLALMEVQSLAALGSQENIVGYYSSWFEDEHLYIQMEICDYSVSMQKSSHLFTEDEALVVLHQIAKALSFVHSGGIAHLDVKPDNIYVKSGIYKLGDFGCATLLDKSLPVEEGDAREGGTFAGKRSIISESEGGEAAPSTWAFPTVSELAQGHDGSEPRPKALCERVAEQRNIRQVEEWQGAVPESVKRDLRCLSRAGIWAAPEFGLNGGGANFVYKRGRND
ncbi:hypothetical protein MLD38_040022 [Melastoma candidum]|uniref:Uncharacterized protein n=1 Tax=Melastoma candidum TaxID=119954 RepID=A0ACB9L3Z1_9MYRT|nr:hypothetical protein MLD38_040022 [Melastoma candidum]